LKKLALCGAKHSFDAELVSDLHEQVAMTIQAGSVAYGPRPVLPFGGRRTQTVTNSQAIVVMEAAVNQHRRAGLQKPSCPFPRMELGRFSVGMPQVHLRGS
jgi:hypothetical protein